MSRKKETPSEEFRRLADVCEAAGIIHSRLAALLGVSGPRVSQCYKGGNPGPRLLRDLRALAAGLAGGPSAAGQPGVEPIHDEGLEAARLIRELDPEHRKTAMDVIKGFHRVRRRRRTVTGDQDLGPLPKFDPPPSHHSAGPGPKSGPPPHTNDDDPASPLKA